MKFNNDKKIRSSELIEEEKTIAYMINISIEQNNNCFQFKDNIKYL